MCYVEPLGSDGNKIDSDCDFGQPRLTAAGTSSPFGRGGGGGGEE